MIVSGKVKRIKNGNDYYRIKSPVIIVAANTTPDITVAMDNIIGIIVEVNNKLCHAAIIAREYGKPLVMGVEGAMKKFRDNDLVSLNTLTKEIKKI